MCQYLAVPRGAGERHFEYFPTFLDLVGKDVVVVGGGAVATSKVGALLPCGLARLTVIAPTASNSIRRSATSGQLRWLVRDYAQGDLRGAYIAFAATDDRALNRRVAMEARERGIQVLAVDDVPNSDFIAPAVTRRGALTIAISTHGRSPAMARRTREWLEATLPTHWADMLAVAREVRERLGAERRSIAANAWQANLEGRVEDLIRAGDTHAAAELLLARLRAGLAAQASQT